MAEQETPVQDLSKYDARVELERLATQLAKANRAYHTEDAPDISDADYDRLKQRNARIEAAFPDVIHTEDINRPYYRLQRAGYGLMYSLTTWSLIFGCIGFSQHHFDRQSKFWRYFSDASYWFYLAHLPIQFAILILVGDSPWHWTVKFSAYVLGTLAVLLPSYHFLIRPSWIGWMLNGRMESVWRRNRKRQTGNDNDMKVPSVAPAPDVDLLPDTPVPAGPIMQDKNKARIPASRS